MKSFKQKSIFIYIVLSIMTCSFFIAQWSKEKSQYSALKKEMAFIQFTSFSKELHSIANTLEKFSSNLTLREKELFFSAVDKDIRSLNETGRILVYLFKPSNTNGTLIYEQHIWKIENLLTDITRGEITDESQIRLIGTVIKKYSEELSDLFYKEQIGVDGVNSKEGLETITHILTLMNHDMEEVLDK